jgi:hypothetical protein
MDDIEHCDHAFLWYGWETGHLCRHGVACWAVLCTVDVLFRSLFRLSYTVRAGWLAD